MLLEAHRVHRSESVQLPLLQVICQAELGNLSGAPTCSSRFRDSETVALRDNLGFLSLFAENGCNGCFKVPGVARQHETSSGWAVQLRSSADFNPKQSVQDAHHDTAKFIPALQQAKLSIASRPQDLKPLQILRLCIENCCHQAKPGAVASPIFELSLNMLHQLAPPRQLSLKTRLVTSIKLSAGASFELNWKFTGRDFLLRQTHRPNSPQPNSNQS